MGSTVSCHIMGISFYSVATRRKLEEKIIDVVVNRQCSDYKEGDYFKIDATTCMFSPEGLEWHGGVYYDGQTGDFIIVKQRLHQRFCKCMKRCFVTSA